MGSAWAVSSPAATIRQFYRRPLPGTGLRTPVPGVSSRAVLPLDNTARPYSQHTQHQSSVHTGSILHSNVEPKKAGITALDRTLVVSLIERIMVYRDKRVEIVYRWQNDFRWQVELLQRAQQSFSQREAV